jgi:hypothetical protein
MSEDMEIESFTIRDVAINVEGITPYSPSRNPGEDKEKSESWEDFESRVWLKKAHHENGNVFIPGAAFKVCLDEAVKNLNEKVPGKGNQTYTNIIKMGVAPMSDMPLGIRLEDMKIEKVYANANGVRGPGTRVTRWFPIVHSWKGQINLRVFNDNLTQAKFEEFFAKAGLLSGVGRGRPSTGCPMGNGRFRPTKFTWSTIN